MNLHSVEAIGGRFQTKTQVFPESAIVFQEEVFYAKPVDLTVFVYDLPDVFESDLLDNFPSCRTSQWAFEVILPSKIRERHQHSVLPELADFFLVPFPVKCFNNYVARQNKEIVDETFITLVQWISSEHPWFNKSGGLDHVFIFPSGQGPLIFPSHATYIHNSIFILAEGDRSQKHNCPFKDIIVPGYSSVDGHSRETAGKDGGVLLYFRGSLIKSIALPNGTKVKEDNTLRKALVHLLEKEDDILVSGDTVSGKMYFQELSRAMFILCPRGITPWTRRVFDGIHAGTVPVIVSDDVQLPFEADLDWSQISIKVLEADALKPNVLIRRLRYSVQSGEYERKLKNLLKIRHLFSWREEHIVNALYWQLARKKRVFKHGSRLSWD